MNKNKILILVIAILIILSGTIAGVALLTNNNNNGGKNNDENLITDSIKFKDEYESLNNQLNPSGKTYKSVSIDSNNPVVYSSIENIQKVIKNGTGVIYFGFKECPWCRTAVPVLLDAAKETGINRIYYFNDFSIRDVKELDEETGKIVTTQEGTKEYYELLDILGEYASVYKGLNDDEVKRLYAPTVVFVKSGEIIGTHVGTIDSQESGYDELTNDQYMELKKKYTDYMSKIVGTVCDDAC